MKVFGGCSERRGWDFAVRREWRRLLAGFVVFLGISVVAEAYGAAAGTPCGLVLAMGEQRVEWSGQCKGGESVGKGVMIWRQNGEKVREFRGGLKEGLPDGPGVMVWQDGRTLEGVFVAGEADGSSVMVFSGGDRYEGPVVAGMPEGSGRVVRANGDRYEATFSNGAVRGAAKYFFGGEREGDHYSGGVEKHQPQGEGTYFNADGSSFEAVFDAGEIVSTGEFTFANGDRWHGPVVARQAEGKGSLLLANGDRIDGGLLSGQMGPGSRYRFANGAAFVGTLVANRPQGRGLLLLRSGERVWGEVDATDGTVGGDGRFAYVDGRVFDGVIKKNLPHGKGVLALPSGEKIEIEYRDGLPVGSEVVIQYPNGDRYQGETLEYLPHGKGVLATGSGQRYSGTFAKGVPNGSMNVVYGDGSKFDGVYVEGGKSGKGVYSWPDGAHYDGLFADGLPNGRGEFDDAAGFHYVGEFFYGLPTGEGRMEFASGRIVKGRFDNGVAEGAGEFTMPDKSRWVGKFSADREEGPGSVFEPDGDKTDLLFAGGMPKEDDGPFFSMFKNKLDELSGLVNAGFDYWGQRYYLANRKYFDGNLEKTGPVLDRLRKSLAGRYLWREKHWRRLARMQWKDAGRLRGVADLSPALSYPKSALQVRRDAEAQPMLAAGSNELGAPGDDMASGFSGAYSEAMLWAVSAGRLGDAVEFFDEAEGHQLQAASRPVEVALSALVVRNPRVVVKQGADFDLLQERLIKAGVALDMAKVEAGLVDAFNGALKNRDVAEALAFLAVAKKLNIALLNPSRTDDFVRLVASSLGGETDVALFVKSLDALKAHGVAPAQKELVAAWLELFAGWIERGDVQPALEALDKVSERDLVLTAATEGASVRLVKALTRRLKALDADGWLRGMDGLARRGFDLPAGFREKVVLLRAGVVSTRTPYSLRLTDGDGFRFTVLDESSGQEAALIDALSGATHVLLVDVHPRYAVHRLTSHNAVAGSFQDGNIDEPNPAYERIAAQLAAADQAAAKTGQRSGLSNLPTNTGNDNVDKVMGVLGVLGAISDVTSAVEESGVIANAEMLRSQLANTPRMLSRPRIVDYNFEQVAMEVVRGVPATLYLVDVGQGRFSYSPLEFRQRDVVETTFGIHMKDKLSFPGETPGRVRALERQALSLTLPQLVLASLGPDSEAALLQEEEEPQSRIDALANLPTIMATTRDTREAASMRWIEAIAGRFDEDVQKVMAGLHEEGRARSEPMVEVLRIPPDLSADGPRDAARLGELLQRAMLRKP